MVFQLHVDSDVTPVHGTARTMKPILPNTKLLSSDSADLLP